MCERNLYPVIKLMIKLLQIQYLWPKNNTKCSPKFYFILYARHILALPLVIGVIAKKYQIFNGTGKFQFDEDFILIFTQLLIIHAILSYGGIVDDLAEKYQTSLQLNNYGIPEDFNNFNERMDLYTKIAFIYFQFTILLAVTSPFLDYKNCMKRKRNMYKICGLINIWAPVDITNFPYNLLIFILTFYTYFTVYSTILSITFYSALMSKYMTFRFSYAKILYGKANGVLQYNVRKRILFHAIEYHHQILQLTAQTLDALSQRINYLYTVQTSIVLGICIYGSVKEFQLFYLAVSYGYLVQFTLQCYCGQKLMDESESVGTMVYIETNWYEWEVDLQKHLVIILRRSQIPLRTRAGSFGYLHFEYLISVYRAAYSYLMFLTSAGT